MENTSTAEKTVVTFVERSMFTAQCCWSLMFGSFTIKVQGEVTFCYKACIHFINLTIVENHVILIITVVPKHCWLTNAIN
jgi:hypothetical protein